MKQVQSNNRKKHEEGQEQVSHDHILQVLSLLGWGLYHLWKKSAGICEMNLADIHVDLTKDTETLPQTRSTEN